MKGAITSCLSQLVEAKFGKDKWKEVLKDAGAEKATDLRLASADIPDVQVMTLLKSTCKVTGLTAVQAADAFGEYWCCTYVPKVYSAYARNFKNAREMILGMDKVHDQVTKSMANARPPRFDYRWENDRTLVVTYKSNRGMIDIYVGLVRGVGKYFRESLTADKTSATQVRILFAA